MACNPQDLICNSFSAISSCVKSFSYLSRNDQLTDGPSMLICINLLRGRPAITSLNFASKSAAVARPKVTEVRYFVMTWLVPSSKYRTHYKIHLSSLNHAIE